MNKQETEDSFRKSLQDVVIIVERLSAFCPTATELLNTVRLAVECEGVLRLLMKAVLEKGK